MESTDFPSYEGEHSRFVSTENGTTSVEVVSVLTSVALLPFLSSLFFPWLIPVKLATRSASNPRLHIFLRFLIEFPNVVILPCFLVTHFTSDLHGPSATTGVTATLFATCLLILTINHTVTRPTWTSWSNEWRQLKYQDVQWNSSTLTVDNIVRNTKGKLAKGAKENKPKSQNYPFLTNARGMVNYISILCILAIDFPIFPRRFAKTQKFGVSLMDIGTASFIFANGIVSPEAKHCRPNFKKSIASCLPLFVLGFGRLLAIKGTEYQEVVEEYGVHWNFFFTLAAVKIMSTIMFTLFHTKFALRLFITTGIVYEACLLRTNIQESYLLNPAISREISLINANREGIFSTIGYQAIYLASVYCGQRIFNKRKDTIQDWSKYLWELVWQGTITWSLFFSWHNYGNPSCRRIANLSYVLWAVAMSYTILFANLFVSLAQTVSQKLGILHGPIISYHLYLKNLKESGQHFESPYQNQTQEQEAHLSAKYHADNFHKLASKTDVDDLHATKKVDRRLKKMNKKLNRLQSKGDGIDKETFDFDTFEEELESLGHKILKQDFGDHKQDQGDSDSNSNSDSSSDSDQDNNAHDVGRNLVRVPDLTKASLFYEAIGFNGLLVFLLGNLLTGLVNYSILAMYTRPILATTILLCYSTAIYFTSFLLYWFNIRMKFW